MNQSIIRDPSLAAEGMQRIQWVEKFMPVLNALRKEMKGSSVLKGKTVVMSIHLEAKTAYLALTLQAAAPRHCDRKQSRCPHRIPLPPDWTVRGSACMPLTDAPIRNIQII